MKPSERKIQPPAMIARMPELAGPDITFLPNGVPVCKIASGKEDIIRADFIFRAGQVFEKNHLTSSCVNMMLNEGSEDMTAEEVNRRLDFFGAVPNFFTEKDVAGLSIAFLSKHSRKIFGLCHDMLFKPVFPDEELRSLLKKRLQWHDVRQERVQSVANDLYFESVFGSSHPYGRITHREDFSLLRRENLVEFHKRHYSPANLSIVIAGNITREAEECLASVFGTLKAGRISPAQEFSLPAYSSLPRIEKHKEGALQSAIRIGSATINKRNSDYPGLKVVDTLLGGYFGSRLMKNIREDKGYTYGIHSSVSSYDQSGYMLISTEVGSGYTEKAVSEIHHEINRLATEPVGIKELDIVRNFMMGELVRMFDGPFATAESFRSAWEFGLGYDYFKKLAARIVSITPDEIMHLAKTYYKQEYFVEVVVGP